MKMKIAYYIKNKLMTINERKKNLFIFLGIIIEIIFLSFYLIEPIRKMVGETALTMRSSLFFIWIVIALLIILELYIIGFRLVVKNDINLKIIIFFILLFNLSLFLMWPKTAVDLFNYLSSARIFSTYHFNPYIYTYNLLPTDAFYNLITNVWSAYPTTYGSIFTLFSSFLTYIGGDNFNFTYFLFKFSILITNLLNCFLIYKITNKKELVYLYGWNPIIIFEFCINAHNDVYCIFFVLLSIYFLYKKSNLINYLLSFLFLVLAALIKYITLILIPIFFFIVLFNIKSISKKIQFILFSVLIFCSVIFLSYLPFWDGMQIFNRLTDQAGNPNGSLIFSSFTILSIFWFLSIIDMFFFVINNKILISTITGKLIFLISYFFLIIYLIYKNKKINKYKFVLYSLTALILFYLTFFAWIVPWYYTLLITLLIVELGQENKKEYNSAIYFISLMSILCYIVLR